MILQLVSRFALGNDGGIPFVPLIHFVYKAVLASGAHPLHPCYGFQTIAFSILSFCTLSPLFGTLSQCLNYIAYYSLFNTLY